MQHASLLHDQVAVGVGFTGTFDGATQVTFFTAKDNALTEADAADIAKTLGLTNKQSDKGTLLWTGDKFRLRYMRDPAGSNMAMIAIKTDQDQEVVTPRIAFVVNFSIDRTLIAHELTQVLQYERFGGIKVFLKAYIPETADGICRNTAGVE